MAWLYSARARLGGIPVADWTSSQVKPWSFLSRTI